MWVKSRHSKMGCYQQIINSPQWCWGHFNKPIQGGLLLLGIMISGSSVFYMNNGGYIHQRQSLLEPFYVCWYTGHFSLIRAQRVVWYLYFHRYKNPNKTIRALQISITEKMGKHPKSENIWNVAEDGKARVLKRLIFILLTCLCLLRVRARNFCTKSFLLSYEAWHMKVSWIMHLFAGSLQAPSCPNLLPEVRCKVPWGPVSWRTASNDGADYFCKR